MADSKRIIKYSGIAALISLCCFSSCKYFSKGVLPIAELNGKPLYEDEIKSILTPDMSYEDSLKSTESYIRNWAVDELLYLKAEENLTDTKDVDLLVEKYRKSLMIYEYQKQLIQEKLSNPIKESELVDFYKSNTDLYTAHETLFNGIFITMPVTSQAKNEINPLLKFSDISISAIEPIASKYGLRIKYFDNEWTPIAAVQRLGMSDISRTHSFERKNHFESTDEDNIYILVVQDHINVGDLQPFVYVKERIENMMTEQKKVNFLRKLADDAYNEAISSGTLIINEKK
ncbi:MAG: hypothetical protein MJZ00_02850 [Paludibacteraceae bacterium]|nr:hypothetical protein [Paludibacteraceae bacterium]